MIYETLISAETLAKHLDDPKWVIFDCHFLLDQPQAGYHAYLKNHISGAIYAHLEHDLSAPVIPGVTGRHPLAEIETFTQTLSAWGIDETIQVVVYDDCGGGMAARLWWMLHWLGHPAVALLDGGFSHWAASGFPVTTEVPVPVARQFKAKPNSSMIADTPEVIAIATSKTESKAVLVDSRAAPRYRGEIEPIDPVAGHIPGAINADYLENLAPGGLFRSQEALKEKFIALLGDLSTEKVIFYCGSGVTSALNVLALKHSGRGMSRLYPGSWSEWVADPSRPVATKMS